MHHFDALTLHKGDPRKYSHCALSQTFAEVQVDTCVVMISQTGHCWHCKLLVMQCVSTPGSVWLAHAYRSHTYV